VDGREVSSLDLFDGRFTVLAGAAGERWRDICTELALAGVPIASLRLGHEIHDPTGALADVFGLHPHECVLVRPDGYVAWSSADRGSAPHDLRLAVLEVTGRNDASTAARDSRELSQLPL
jgi:hypothetical protein